MRGRAARRAAGALAACALLAASAGCLENTGGIYARMAWSEDGMRVVDVPAGGPAAAAGLRSGDRIVSIDGKLVSMLTLEQAVKRLRGPIGSKVKLEVLRDEKVITLHVRRVAYSQ